MSSDPRYLPLPPGFRRTEFGAVRFDVENPEDLPTSSPVLVRSNANVGQWAQREHDFTGERLNQEIDRSDSKSDSSIRSEDLSGINLGTSIPDSGFSLANQYILLTYKGLLPKDEVILYLENTVRVQCPAVQMGLIRCAHEQGSTGYEHTHIFCNFTKRFQSKSCRVFDFEGIHPNIQRLNTKEHQKNAKRYLGKVDPDNADMLLADQSIADRFSSYNTLTEALGSVQRLNEVQGAITMFRHVHIRPQRVLIQEMRGWQVNLHRELEEKGDSRRIVWYVDKAGKSGKSEFQRHMMRTDPGKVFCSTALDSCRDAATVIKGALDAGWSGNTYMINLTRSQEANTRMYNYLEQIRDGFLTATKYEGGSVDFDIDHFVVFANWYPNIDALSSDRWCVRELKRDSTGTAHSASLTLEEARAKYEESNPLTETEFLRS